MSYTVPLNTARSKVRESKFYKGSSVLAVNTRPNVLKEPQNAKRVIFVNFDKKVTDVLKKGEIQHLYSLDASDWLGWLNKQQESSDKRFDVEKPVPESMNSVEFKAGQELLEFVMSYDDDVVPVKELNNYFEKKFVQKILSSYKKVQQRSNGARVYGYLKQSIIDDFEKAKTTK